MSSPSWRRTISAAIQFTGAPRPEKRPWTITKSPPASMIPGSYFQRGRNALNEIEQALSARLNVSAVLSVVRRPITFGRHIVTLIEQRVERFRDKLLVVL